MNKTYKGIGMMSGTSLDGLDIVYANFWQENLKWRYQILKTNFQEYPEGLYDQLKHAKDLSSKELMLLDVIYGKWLGEKTLEFITVEGVKPGFIASHGYTVFHQPEHSMTLQIGSGNEIFAMCKGLCRRTPKSDESEIIYFPKCLRLPLMCLYIFI